MIDYEELNAIFDLAKKKEEYRREVLNEHYKSFDFVVEAYENNILFHKQYINFDKNFEKNLSDAILGSRTFEITNQKNGIKKKFETNTFKIEMLELGEN